jgi:hypothetical protein
MEDVKPATWGSWLREARKKRPEPRAIPPLRLTLPVRPSSLFGASQHAPDLRTLRFITPFATDLRHKRFRRRGGSDRSRRDIGSARLSQERGAGSFSSTGTTRASRRQRALHPGRPGSDKQLSASPTHRFAKPSTAATTRYSGLAASKPSTPLSTLTTSASSAGVVSFAHLCDGSERGGQSGFCLSLEPKCCAQRRAPLCTGTCTVEANDV